MVDARGRRKTSPQSERKYAHVASDGTAHYSGLAGRYAAALYALASDERALDEVVEQIQALGKLIDESGDFRRLLQSPLIDVNDARAAVLAVLTQEGFGKIVRDFAGVVANNRRLRNLREFVGAFLSLVAERRGVVTAQVITAHPITDLQEQQLRARLIEAGYGNVQITKEVDPSLLGGLVVRIGSRLYDSSLRSRLQRLQFALKGAA
jgi:F-type H+-transporting ATPase subunit delta